MNKVATKLVNLKCGDKSAQVDALVTTAGSVSAMSDRLATQLNIAQQRQIVVHNFGYKVTGYVPSTATQVIVNCKDKSEDSQITVPIAFLIIPSYYHELVLGTDWLSSLSNTAGAMLLFNYPGAEDTLARGGKVVNIGNGYPTPGPGFVPDTMSMCHLLDIGEDEEAYLNIK